MNSIIPKTHEFQLQKQFSLRAGTFNHSAHWIVDEKLVQAHVAAAGKPVGRALEMCCGTGIVGAALTRAGWDVVGIDITKEMVEAAGKHFTAIQGSVENTPFSNEYFDLVIMRQAYFLLGNGSAALREVQRLLRPGGKFILSQTLPFSQIDAEWLRRVHSTKQKQMTKFFTKESLQQELEANGFLVIRDHDLAVRESVTLWMDNAPEVELDRRKNVCDLVVNAPEEYKKLRNVQVVDGEIFEDWNWVIFTTEKR